ncbi:hypothetical protein EZ313_00515 [Ramlibacter henchirensis]|jgi:hypothetical protein|uniref:Uncharacterized protein n=1 Tax=Ramlibacter henchirensis TaxID=204072 RepID=A0A4Z0C0Q9_9BURK|nr:hypothetical protein [Ramlibacter henchirensis]TFZ05197.1 hypothetical protein EZ313_00515 [Ramlibacter henchirensis]
MVNNTCANCRFKGPAVVHLDSEPPQPSLVATATGLFVCLAMRQLGAVRVGAGEATMGGSARSFDLRTGAGVADRSGHGASLCVTDDFGCNRWQPA